MPDTSHMTATELETYNVMLRYEQQQHFQAKRRERAAKFSGRVRHDLEKRISWLMSHEAETEEERRDMRRLWDLMNSICAKHDRKANRF